MKNSRTLFQEVVAGITLPETPGEVNSIVYFLLTGLFDITKTDILAGKMVPFPDTTAQTLQKSIRRINAAEPVQYVLGETYFFGRKFRVNPSVLIPRPETEGLVAAVLSYCARLSNVRRNQVISILDIGTGSGCIPVTISKELSSVKLYATDISTAALSVAVDNATLHGAEITFIEHNILAEPVPVAELDVMVSNPPYVTDREREAMSRNVLHFEPHTALFVPDNDPLLFYDAIARQSKPALKPEGLLALEINPLYAKKVTEVLLDNGFKEVVVSQDVSGKDRVVTGIKA